MPAAITCRDLTIRYATETILTDLALSIPKQSFTAIIGPNGSGKSTLLKALAGLIDSQGTITIAGQDLHQLSPKERAKQLAYVPQAATYPEGITVTDYVAFGRYPYQKRFHGLSQTDSRAINWAIDVCGLSTMASKDLTSLSGGQAQRASLALALAQDTTIILLDEPTTYLDIQYQLDLLDLLNMLATDKGKTVVCVLHDLNLAARYAQHIIALRPNHLYQEGSPQEVITSKTLADLFDITARIDHDANGTPLIQSISRIPH